MKISKVVIWALACCAAVGGVDGNCAAQGRSSRSRHTARTAPVPEPAAARWTFAIAGDSRNCGDVVMPAIAVRARQSGARFYWHLGDFRAIYNFDEDILHQPEHIARPLNILGYEELAWNDFIQNQLVPFGTLPVFLAIGNHETIPPKTREEYLLQFADWIDTPALRRQRLSDDGHDFRLKTYYHWIEAGVDFINLDNATPDQFDSAQLAWFEKVLDADSANPQIHAIVAGMHAALPESVSEDHSMNQSAAGIESGRRVYADLLKAQNAAHKHVYILESHSHYFMDGIFDTEYWRNHGGVLPGWIIGTAGAQRYALPPNSPLSAKKDVYGLLTGSVQPDGEIDFSFQTLIESDVPATVVSRYTPEFVHWCFAENSVAH
jgi:hypothetical protein